MRRFWQVDFHPMEAHTAGIEANPRWTFRPIERLAKCGTVVTRAYSEALPALGFLLRELLGGRGGRGGPGAPRRPRLRPPPRP